MRKVADSLVWGEQLELQAAFAAYHGHRHKHWQVFHERRIDGMTIKLYHLIPKVAALSVCNLRILLLENTQMVE